MNRCFYIIEKKTLIAFSKKNHKTKNYNEFLSKKQIARINWFLNPNKSKLLTKIYFPKELKLFYVYEYFKQPGELCHTNSFNQFVTTNNIRNLIYLIYNLK